MQQRVLIFMLGRISWLLALQGCSAVICMPENSPEIKVNAVRRLGGEVELVGESFYEAMQHALVSGRPLQL